MTTTDPAASPATAAPLLLDADEVARLLGVSRSTFYCLDAKGAIPRGVKLGRLRRWPEAELRRWTEAGCPPRVRWETVKR